MKKSPEYSLKVGDVCIGLRTHLGIKIGEIYTITDIYDDRVSRLIILKTSSRGDQRFGYTVNNNKPALKKASVKEYYHAK